jgi:programmed cell death protein 4
MDPSAPAQPAVTDQQREARDRARSVGCWAGAFAHVEAQKIKISEILNELGDTGSIADAKAAIERNKSVEGIELTKRALIFGIEHNSYERELISQLLSTAYDIFEGREILEGFQLLLYRLPDLVLDVPSATQILAKFISRALYDEILPPVFVKDAHVDNEHAKEALSLAYATLHSDEKRRLEHIWGPGDLRSVDQLKEAVEALLIEYFENPDPIEASRAISDLHAPSFSSQIVKQALRLALDKNSEDARKNVIKLLTSWHHTALVSEFHIKRGFTNISSQLEDLKLDIPNAPEMFIELVRLAVENNVLPPPETGK